MPGLGGCLLWGVSQHALRQIPPEETATAVDGTHPTGMHSCIKIFFIKVLLHFFHFFTFLFVKKIIKDKFIPKNYLIEFRTAKAKGAPRK